MPNAKPDPDLLKHHRIELYDTSLNSGIKELSDVQLLDMLLSFSAPKIDTEKEAERLLSVFNNLNSLISAPTNKLLNEGVSEITVTLLKMLPALTERYYSTVNKDLHYTGSVSELKAFFRPLFMGLGHEEIRVACFDKKMRLTDNVVISKGSVASAALEMRTFLDTVVGRRAKAVAIAHNHPNGFHEPSKSDIGLTMELKGILDDLNIEFIDHIIVGNYGAYSMRESLYDKIFAKKDNMSYT